MFKLTLVTPEKKVVVDQEVTSVVVPAFSGQLELLPGHAPLVTTLETGILSYKLAGTDVAQKAVISWGYCQVNPTGVNILAEYLQTEDEVSKEAAGRGMEADQKKLMNEILNDEDFERTLNHIARAQSAIELKTNH